MKGMFLLARGLRALALGGLMSVALLLGGPAPAWFLIPLITGIAYCCLEAAGSLAGFAGWNLGMLRAAPEPDLLRWEEGLDHAALDARDLSQVRERLERVMALNSPAVFLPPGFGVGWRNRMGTLVHDSGIEYVPGETANIRGVHGVLFIPDGCSIRDGVIDWFSHQAVIVRPDAHLYPGAVTMPEAEEFVQAFQEKWRGARVRRS